MTTQNKPMQAYAVTMLGEDENDRTLVIFADTPEDARRIAIKRERDYRGCVVQDQAKLQSLYLTLREHETMATQSNDDKAPLGWSSIG